MKNVFIVLPMLLIVSCATVVRGTSQKVQINSSPSHAKVQTTNGQTCSTPCVMVLPRNKSTQLFISKKNCITQNISLIPTLMTEGVMLGGVVDYATGAVYDLQPNPVFANLQCNKQV